LKDVDKEILFLRHVQQFTYEEIAGVVGLRTGTVRTRISRARQKLVELTEGREKDETSQLG
jgi:RNA polymerase sigma-70 factor (ECF subfamily)